MAVALELTASQQATETEARVELRGQERIAAHRIFHELLRGVEIEINGRGDARVAEQGTDDLDWHVRCLPAHGGSVARLVRSQMGETSVLAAGREDVLCLACRESSLPARDERTVRTVSGQVGVKEKRDLGRYRYETLKLALAFEPEFAARPVSDLGSAKFPNASAGGQKQCHEDAITRRGRRPNQGALLLQRQAGGAVLARGFQPDVSGGRALDPSGALCAAQE